MLLSRPNRGFLGFIEGTEMSLLNYSRFIVDRCSYTCEGGYKLRKDITKTRKCAELHLCRVSPRSVEASLVCSISVKQPGLTALSRYSASSAKKLHFSACECVHHYMLAAVRSLPTRYSPGATLRRQVCHAYKEEQAASMKIHLWHCVLLNSHLHVLQPESHVCKFVKIKSRVESHVAAISFVNVHQWIRQAEV